MMAELNLYGPIGYNETETEGVTAGMFAKWLKDVPPDEPLTVFVNSPGGSVFDGLTIYQQLVNRPGENHFVLQGVTASIASVIAMAGDTITIGQASRIMIHNPMGPSAIAFGTAGDLREAAEDTLKTADLLDSVRESIIDVYAARASVSRDAIGKQMDAETWLTASEAVAIGFADKIAANKTLAASASRKPVAYAMRNIKELQDTATLCQSLQLRNGPTATRPSEASRLHLAKAKLDSRLL